MSKEFIVQVKTVPTFGFGHDQSVVTVTDPKTGLFEECGTERSMHRNCEIAKERLKERLKSVDKKILKVDNINELFKFGRESVKAPTREEIMQLWESVLNANTKNRSVKMIVLTFSFLLLKKARGG